jgi:hypothetical protein
VDVADYESKYSLLSNKGSFFRYLNKFVSATIFETKPLGQPEGVDEILCRCYEERINFDVIWFKKWQKMIF